MGTQLSEAYRRLGAYENRGQKKHHNFDGQRLGADSARTFNLVSRRATMPSERHRVARLAGESVLRLLQQPIPLSRGKGRRLFARDGVGDFGLREAGAGPPLEAPGRELGLGSGIYGPMRIAIATAPSPPNYSGTRRLALLAGRWARE